MQQFFDAAFAANLQFFALPMEIVGFSLALIEVRYPETAKRLARVMARLAEPIARIRTQAEAGSRDAAEKSVGAQPG